MNKEADDILKQYAPTGDITLTFIHGDQTYALGDDSGNSAGLGFEGDVFGLCLCRQGVRSFVPQHEFNGPPIGRQARAHQNRFRVRITMNSKLFVDLNVGAEVWVPVHEVR